MENETFKETLSLSDELNSYIKYTEASLGKRFLNFVVDNLLMRYGLSYLTGSLIGYMMVTLAPEFTYKLFNDESSFGFILLAYIFSVVNYLIYYTFCEKVFRGYMLGKLISGTRAVRQDGEELTFKDAILRSLVRLIPFEPLSALGRKPWHDTWTNTMVVKSR